MTQYIIFKVSRRLPYIRLCNTCDPHMGQLLAPMALLEKTLVDVYQMMQHKKISRLHALFQTRRFSLCKHM